jgi:hypothetical protein
VRYLDRVIKRAVLQPPSHFGRRCDFHWRARAHTRTPRPPSARKRSPRVVPNRLQPRPVPSASHRCRQIAVSECDAQVQPKRRVTHIPFVEGTLLLVGNQVAAIDLSPAGDAGADRKSDVHVLRLIVGQQWSWPYQGHVTDQYIEELRQFINPCCAQAAADKRKTPVRRQFPPKGKSPIWGVTPRKLG